LTRLAIILALAALAGPAWSQDQSLAQDHCVAGGGCFCTWTGWEPAAPGTDHPYGRPIKMCGTVADFQRNADIVCLKADAVGHPDIVASSLCYGAKMAAQKVDETRTRQAADQARAIEARRRLHELGVNQ
jgi:hypothetical protein